MMDFVLKDLYGKIEAEGKGNPLDKGNVLWTFWVMFFEVHMVMVSALQRGRGQSPKHPQRGGSRHGNDRGSRGLSGDRHRNDQSRPRGDDRAKDHLQGKELRAEPKKIQPKDQIGSTLEQDLSSLLVQQLMQENEEL